MSPALTTINATPVSSLTIRSSTDSSSKPSSHRSLDVGISRLPNCTQNASVGAPIALSPVPRRNIIALGIASTMLGLNIEERNALAAARRPPPQPTQEKKDPNISGVQAKVLASKKRKEAMKQAMAEQRDRGKKIEESTKSFPPPPPPPPPPPSPPS